MSTSTESASLLSLAEGILEKTKELTTRLEADGLTAPTFSPLSSWPPATPDYRELQGSLRTMLGDLQRLVDGPALFYRHFVMRNSERAAFQIALDFDLFAQVPAEGDISLEDLARRAGLDIDRTRRVVRLLITYRFFEERVPGFVSHNSFSLALNQDEEMRAFVHFSFDEMLKAASEAGAALKAHPQEWDDAHCPFSTRYGVPIYRYYSEHPEQASRFARAMAGWRKMGNHTGELVNWFPWARLNGTVVDIGGGSGHVSVVLAQHFPHLNFIVQDESDDVLSQGQAHLADDVRGRISFARASFFEPQPYKGAAAYLIRQCTHNWPDRDVVKMFRCVVPGLEGSASGTPLLINDVVLPEPGAAAVPPHWEREMRQLDVVMLINHGAKERTRAEFEALLKEADPRYEVARVHVRGAMGLLEVYLKR